jgi:hypothetical protein
LKANTIKASIIFQVPGTGNRTSTSLRMADFESFLNLNSA